MPSLIALWCGHIDALKNAGSILSLSIRNSMFSSGFKQYYKPIMQGRILVLSTFHPKAPWSVDLAMARNPIIYGLAEEIYAAQSDSKGGTWSGVMDGLKRGRKIYVRVPDAKERNANLQLIVNGAVGVDINGYIIEYENKPSTSSSLMVSESTNKYNKIPQDQGESSIENKIIECLKKGHYTVKQLIQLSNINWRDAKMRNFLESIPNIRKEKKGRSNSYSLLEVEENSLPGL